MAEKSEGMATVPSSAKPESLMMASAPTARVHHDVPTSPTEPSARSITGTPSIMEAPMRSRNVAATPSARRAIRARKLARRA